ncbi:phosphate-starvation-inducible E [bacterium BMS3Abin11]|nr:phosphate-starvation-inducible E [bacterium BMS3Abin11]
MSKIVILNVLMILAIIEVYKTTLSYFAEGRVKVTYIIDTALVVILTEVMAFWFMETEYSRLTMVIALVFTLIVARIMTIRFSSTKVKGMDKKAF